MALLDAELWSGKIFINGWVAGGGGTRDVVAPATGEVLGSIGLASVDDVLNAAQVAAAAQVAWAARKPEERAAVLRKAGELIEHYSDEIHAFNMRECGSIPA